MAALKKHIWWIAAAAIMILLLLPAGETAARPGGGSGYSGGGGGGGSSGGGGDSGDIGFLIYLIVRYPHITIPIIIIAVIIHLLTKKKGPTEEISTQGHDATKSSRIGQVRNQLIRYAERNDPNFSRVLFLDFAQRLHYMLQKTRSTPEFQNLRPYFDPEFFDGFVRTHPGHISVSEIVVASAEITSFHQNEKWDTITVTIDSNFTETRGNNSRRYWYVQDWAFRRRRGVLSKGPEQMQNPGCPNCGSKLELKPTMECAHCGVIVQPGEQTWEVAVIRTNRSQAQGATSFGHYTAEQGTDLPTVVDPRLVAMTDRFVQAHNITDGKVWWTTFQKNIAETIFRKVYESWSRNDWEPVRPLLTDHLFASQYYWISDYKKKQVFNRLDDLKVADIKLVKVELDKWYEAITVRIFASVKDYIADEKGNVVAGSRAAVRHFSEYWTFIRRTGVEKSEASYNPSVCPSCGAPLNIGMSGVCAYCNSKVTSGEFGWVLAVIAQDDTYQG